MLFLVESFYSFQGEGKFAGVPSVFIRLGGCNLSCPGFGVEFKNKIGCDSFKAVNREYFEHIWLKVDDLISVINSYLDNLNFKPDIVFTGGEPLLYFQNPTLLETLVHFQDYRVTFETNATIEIDFEKFPIYKDVVFAMSVKLKNSGENRAKRINQDAIKRIVENTKDSFFKFVLSKKDIDTKEIKEITKNYPNVLVYCMPMGESAKELSKNDKQVAQFCIQNGYNYTDRIHIRLWDNEEGR